MRVLSLRELNRATLARQLLLERRRLPVLRALERLAGMQAQWPPAPYVGLWSRVAGFRREPLERAVLRGDAVRATLMRSTLHLVSARDYDTFSIALRGMLTWVDSESEAIAERIAPELRTLFVNGGVVSRTKALAYLEREHGLTDPVRQGRVLHHARILARVVHAPETGVWTAQPRTAFAALADAPDVDPHEARVELVRRYLTAFGPASTSDLAQWSGMRVRDLAGAVDALEPLRRFRSEDGKTLLDLPRAPLAAADAPAPVRLLPKWDNLLLAHADRRRVLPDEYRKAVIAKNGDVAQTFLVDGVVAGTWSVRRSRVEPAPFAPLPRPVRRELEDEAKRLEEWLR